MNAYKQLLPRTILIGSMSLAAMLLVSTPSCKAQEVSPDHFTDTGVQDVYDAAPAKKPVTKLVTKEHVAAHVTPVASTQAIATHRKTNAVARKQKTLSAPSL
jgi:hypothetical protein